MYVYVYIITVIIDAPHTLNEEIIDATGNTQPLRTWWFNDKCETESGMQQSMDHIRNILNEQVT